MKKLLLLCCSACFLFNVQGQTPGQQGEKVLLPNGWSLSPAGTSIALGDLPLNLVLSHNGKLAAVTNNGVGIQTIQLLSAKKRKLLHTVAIDKSWYGLAFSHDDQTLYASGGHNNRIMEYAVKGNKLLLRDSLVLGKPWPNRIGPAGIALHSNQPLLYTVTRDDSALYVMNTASRKLEKRIQLDAEGYTCLLSPDQNRLYISVWGADHIAILNTANNTIEHKIPVGDNPNEMVLTRDGQWLYVCNANDNSVSVIHTPTLQVKEVLITALFPDAPSGSTANALTLSADEKTLYVANADNNCLAVFEVEEKGFSKSEGFIPTGWYPTSVKVVGKKLWVTNGKGFRSMANPQGPSPVKPRSSSPRHLADTTTVNREQYIGGLFMGTLSMMSIPGERQLAACSKEVYANSPFTAEKMQTTLAQSRSPFETEQSPVRHVFYIIKENRTYDQVLGDMPGGNGDTSIVLFGARITPNQHKLASTFVLFDNFYTNGEVSADGHNWSMGAYATDYLEKTWPTSYGGRGGSYGAEGERAIANNKNGFIWDLCKRNGISYRSYGEFADNGKANIPALEGHFCPYFTGYDTRVQDTVRFYQWKRDFDSLLAIGQVPQLNTIRFGNDHTDGLRLGRPTPFAHVADNDLAVGMFIEYLSKTPIWKECAVFIVEDDAQNGPDHVDAHRTTAYLAGPFIKRNYVDHTMYSTSSMLRTMELLLGLPPMTQYDAAATPMWNAFTASPDFTAFKSLPSNISLADRNTALNYWQRLSETFDLSKEDAAPDLEFSQVIWHAVKGLHVPFPGPRRAAFVVVRPETDDDD